MEKSEESCPLYSVSVDQILRHHEKTGISYSAKIEWWKDEIESGRRCCRCWLRKYECFCSKISKMKLDLSKFQEKISTRMCIYYHYQELGRSANTAHLYEAIFNSQNGNENLSESTIHSSCETLRFGDYDKEMEFLRELNEEQENNCPVTCVLYPSSKSIPLSEWMAARPVSTTQNRSVRLVVLDGTYPQASRQFKYLSHAFQLLYQKEVPVVRLDLGDTPVRSALYGIQSQPGINKLCSYQAMILAVRQIGQTPGKIYTSFSSVLCRLLTTICIFSLSIFSILRFSHDMSRQVAGAHFGE